jgi:CheY-like chemotaxis protein
MPGQLSVQNNNITPRPGQGIKPSALRPAPWQIERLQAHTLSYPILVTDDDTMSRTLYRALFQHDSLTHLDTRDSAEALRICRSQPVSVVISDIMKPKMDGLQMLQHLRADPATSHIPLLFVTGSSRMRETALQAGADGFLCKPCHPNEILQEIWRLLFASP